VKNAIRRPSSTVRIADRSISEIKVGEDALGSTTNQKGSATRS